MNDWGKWQERVRDIRATSTTWWWWWWWWWWFTIDLKFYVKYFSRKLMHNSLNVWIGKRNFPQNSSNRQINCMPSEEQSVNPDCWKNILWINICCVLLDINDIYIYIYIYIYIVITDRSVSFNQNSSVWLDILASRGWDRNPVDSNANIYICIYKFFFIH